MFINLKSLKEEGEVYNFNRTSEEFEGVLDDIVGQRDFEVSIEIKPLGNSFELRGTFTTSYQDRCSKCGYDVEVPITNKINEILVIEKERPRDTQSVHGQNSVKFDGQGPSVTYLTGEQFHLSEFVHEMVASSMEAYPECADKKKCQTQQFQPKVHEIKPEKGHPAFQVLEALKTKH